MQQPWIFNCCTSSWFIIQGNRAVQPCDFSLFLLLFPSSFSSPLFSFYLISFLLSLPYIFILLLSLPPPFIGTLYIPFFSFISLFYPFFFVCFLFLHIPCLSCKCFACSYLGEVPFYPRQCLRIQINLPDYLVTMIQIFIRPFEYGPFY